MTTIIPDSAPVFAAPGAGTGAPIPIQKVPTSDVKCTSAVHYPQLEHHKLLRC